MAVKRISTNDLIEPGAISNIITEAVKLEVALKSILTINKEIVKENPFKTGKDVQKYNEATAQIVTNEEALQKVKKQRETLERRLLEVQSEEAKQNEAIKLQISEQTKALKLQVQLENQQLGTLKKLQVENAKLRKEREGLDLQTKQGQKRLQEINKELDKNNNFIKENSDQLKQQKLNVGNYKDSVKDALRESGLFGGVIGKLTQAQQGLGAAQKVVTATTKASAGGFRALAVAIAATGIGALVIALGLLVTAFTKTQAGGEAARKILAQVGQVFNVLLDRAAKLGGAIVELFSGNFQAAAEQAKAALTGIGDELVREVELVGVLEETLIRLEKAQSVLNLRTAEYRSEIKKLNIDVENTRLSIEERIAAAERVLKLENELLQEQQAIARERERNLFQNTKTSEEIDKIVQNVLTGATTVDEVIAQIGFNDSTFKDFEEFIELRKELSALEQSSFELQSTFNNKLNILLDKQEKDRLERLRQIEERKKSSVEFSVLEQKTAVGVVKAEETRLITENKLIDALEEELATQKSLLEIQEERRQQAIASAIEQTEQFAMITNRALEDAERRASRLTDIEIERAKTSLDTQQRLAEQGLANTLAFEQQKAAKLEAERERLAKRAEKRQKTLAYLTAFTEYLKQDPNSAAGKALAQVAIAETVSGFFHEGTEEVGKDGGTKWRNTGKDDYLVAVHKGERIMTAEQNRMVGDLSNEDLANIAYYHRTQGVAPSFSSATFSDNQLQKLSKSIAKSIDISIDTEGFVTRKEFEAGIRKIVKFKPSRRI